MITYKNQYFLNKIEKYTNILTSVNIVRVEIEKYTNFLTSSKYLLKPKL